jgi:hypothetical protein
MTYPQPGGYGSPSGGFPQQGGFGPTGGYAQPGGYGPPSGGFPQPGGYGQFPPGPPKKTNTAAIVAFCGVLVAAIVSVVLVLVLGGDEGADDKESDSASGETEKKSGISVNADYPEVPIPPPNVNRSPTNRSPRSSTGSSGGSGASSADSLARQVAEIIEDKDSSAVDEFACSSTDAYEFKRDLDTLGSVSVTATAGTVTESGSSARTTIYLAMPSETVPYPLLMRQQGSGWCAYH